MFLGEDRRAPRPAGRQRNRRRCWRHVLEDWFCCARRKNARERGPGETRAHELLIENKENGGGGVIHRRPRDCAGTEDGSGD
ncbi:hypothetical protein FKM82_022300, partial [Ascaphus truei]